MIQALYRKRQTGKTTELANWLSQVDNHLLIVWSNGFKKNIVEYFFKNNIAIDSENIIVYHNIDRLKEKIIGKEFDRIGIDNIWYMKDPNQLLKECQIRSKEIAIVFDEGEPFIIVDELT